MGVEGGRQDDRQSHQEGAADPQDGDGSELAEGAYEDCRSSSRYPRNLRHLRCSAAVLSLQGMRTGRRHCVRDGGRLTGGKEAIKVWGSAMGGDGGFEERKQQN